MFISRTELDYSIQQLKYLYIYTSVKVQILLREEHQNFVRQQIEL